MFQRPQHPDMVVRMDGRRRFGVHRLQLRIHGFRTLFIQFRGQLFPQTVRRFLGSKADTIQKTLDIEPGAAHEDGQMLSVGDLTLQRPGQRGEICHAERFIRLQDIHPMVRNAVGLLGGHLGGANIKTFVDLHRIGADDLPAELLGQRNAQRGLAGSCGADHGQHRVLFVTRSVQTVFPAPSGSI